MTAKGLSAVTQLTQLTQLELLKLAAVSQDELQGLVLRMPSLREVYVCECPGLDKAACNAVEDAVGRPELFVDYDKYVVQMPSLMDEREMEKMRAS